MGCTHYFDGREARVIARDDRVLVDVGIEPLSVQAALELMEALAEAIGDAIKHRGERVVAVPVREDDRDSRW